MNAAIGSTISSNSAATSADGLQIDDSNVAIVRSTISKKHVPYRGRNFCKWRFLSKHTKLYRVAKYRWLCDWRY